MIPQTTKRVIFGQDKLSFLLLKKLRTTKYNWSFTAAKHAVRNRCRDMKRFLLRRFCGFSKELDTKYQSYDFPNKQKSHFWSG